MGVTILNAPSRMGMRAMHRIPARMPLPADHSAMIRTFLRFALLTRPMAMVQIILLRPTARPASSVVVLCCFFFMTMSATMPPTMELTTMVNMAILKKPLEPLENSEMPTDSTTFITMASLRLTSWETSRMPSVAGMR